MIDMQIITRDTMLDKYTKLNIYTQLKFLTYGVQDKQLFQYGYLYMLNFS